MKLAAILSAVAVSALCGCDWQPPKPVKETKAPKKTSRPAPPPAVSAPVAPPTYSSAPANFSAAERAAQKFTSKLKSDEHHIIPGSPAKKKAPAGKKSRSRRR